MAVKEELGMRWLISLVLALALFPAPAFAISNAPIHWGLKRSENHEPPSAGKELDELLAKYDAFYLGDTSEKTIYLTFDNGYENGYTAQILDVLKEKHVPAAVFCHRPLFANSARFSQTDGGGRAYHRQPFVASSRFNN